MALTTATVDADHSGGHAPNAPVRLDHFAITGDAAYAAGGSAAFEAFVRSELGQKVTVIGVIPGECSGYVPVYDKANDKLKIYQALYGGGPAAPLVEDATANQSGRTYNMIVVSV